MAGLIQPKVKANFHDRLRENSEGLAPLARSPAFYLVVIHKDEITPSTIVIQVLLTVFSKPKEEATRIVSLAKCFGVCVVSSYPFEIAETKAEQGRRLAENLGFVLRFTVQKEG